jgi:hypothetical protein
MDIEDESDDASGRLHNLDHKVNTLCCQWPDSDVTVDSEIIYLRVTIMINEPVDSESQDGLWLCVFSVNTRSPRRRRRGSGTPKSRRRALAPLALTGSLPPWPQCSFQPG